MDLVVGASESTMKSLLAKLGALLAQEYTLIRGVGGDLQYITDELRTMQSFLRDLGDAKQDHRMKDWMKQIRDMTYDVEDCIDDSGQRIYNPRWLRSNMCCYFLVNSIYEIWTWWPRRDIASKISDLKMRAQHISERRQRYGVENPKTNDQSMAARGFDAAGNQDRCLQLVSVKDPVGANKYMTELEGWLKDEDNKFGVLSIVGFGGLGKTTIANDLYNKLGDQFEQRAVVTVSQSSDIEAILENIMCQIKPPSQDPENSVEDRGGAACQCLGRHIRRGKSAVKAICPCLGTSEEKQDGRTRDKLNNELQKHFKEISYLVLIDDVWSASTWEDILVAFPRTEDHKKRGRVIVTTRFSAVATARRGTGHHVYNVDPLHPYESNILFYQALSESKSNEHIHIPDIPAQIWKICGGLPLAIMAMAGFVACNTYKALDWEKISYSLFPEKKRIQELLGGSLLISTHGESGKDTRKGLTREELGKIVSYCYNDMPAEIITCSLFLSIYPKGSRISRKRLIRRWIAEGFVSEKDGMTVEDVAETYFSHMVKRNMIRPVEHSSSGKVKQCVVHDMVLEHIVSKATEENFSVVVGGHWLMQPPSTKIRRLSLQGSDPKRAKDMEKMNLSHIRSLTMFETMNQLPSRLFRFEIVQVLDFDGCKGFKEDYMKQICSMLLVKYLSLRRTDTKELPDTIGKLENLETLDIRQTKIFALPKDACNLGRLVNILGGDKEKHRALKLPEDFLRKKKMMKAVRILSGIEIVGGSEDLSHMTDLRKLVIYNLNFTGDDARLKLSTAIGYLCCYSLRTLVIHDDSSKFLKCLDDMTSPPKSLVSLELSGKMNKLPSWITKLDALTKLTLSMTALRANYLNHLSKLGTLFSLTFSIPAGKECPETIAMMVKNKMLSDGEIIFPDGGFESLKLLRLSAPLVPVLSFSENAMPKLERLEIQFTMLEGIYGVENLSRLEEVYLRLNDKQGEAMANKTAKELKRAVNNVAARSRKARIILLIS